MSRERLLRLAVPEADSLTPGYFDEHDIEALVRERAVAVDRALQGLWQAGFADDAELCLLATGGYGRGELHPCSDVDILLLGEEAALKANAAGLEQFIQSLWDLGLKIGHQVTSPADALRLASADVSVLTSHMESRLLAGSEEIAERFLNAINAAELWPPRAYLDAKLDEQRRRHRRFSDTTSNLEPNIKEAPGGLRDVQTIIWVAKRAYRHFSLSELTEAGFLDDDEGERLLATRRYLWQVRYALHCLAGRAEERLLFDHQRQLAAIFGYEGEGNTAVEAFMQHHYRRSTALERLNERVLASFHEEFAPPGASEPQIIDGEFQIIDQHIARRDEDLFSEQPLAMLRLFARWQEQPEIQGIRAATIRSLRANLHRFDDGLRADGEARRLFIRYFEQERPAQVLTHMARYGVLGAYLPAFEAISGRMQFDLFHVYTVDEHTLKLLRELELLLGPDAAGVSPLAASVGARLGNHRRLYIAALFHDLAKGRDGDHSELGAEDAEEFCREHGLPPSERKLVVWLVRHHLLMSMTAQKRDINDPLEIESFARQVGHQSYLDHLYLLTIADIRATNPKLWNSWKARLLDQLYEMTRLTLRRGLDEPMGRQAQIEDTQSEAMDRLQAAGLSASAVRTIWAPFPEEYFLRHSVSEIHWQTLAISAVNDEDLPLVLVRQQTERGTTEVFIYTNNQSGLFAAVTGILDNLGLTIVDARIIGTYDGYTLDTFQVLEGDGQPVTYERRLNALREALPAQLAKRKRAQVRITRRASRIERQFDEPVRLQFSAAREPNRTRLEVYCSDRPGILCAIGRAFNECHVQLHDARIATFGNRVEDLFLISTDQDQAFDEDQRDQLAQCLRSNLDDARQNDSMFSMR